MTNTLKKSVSNILDMSMEKAWKFLNSFDTVVTDCDGVLWVSGQAIPGSPEVLNRLRELGKKIFYVTNNSTKTRDELVEGATKLGYIAHKEEIISTAYLTAAYLKSIEFTGKAYVIGQTGITQELDNINVRHTGSGPDILEDSLQQAIDDFKIDPQINAVIVGFDRFFSYPKLLKAATYLGNPDCLFIATNTDERFPGGAPKVLPGTGTFVSAVETCALRKPIVMGKPSSYVGTVLVQEHKIDPERTLMIGDRCNTDIMLGSRCGFQTLLVLSGVHSLKDVAEYQKSNQEEDKEMIPDVYLPTLGDLVKFLPQR